MIAQRDAGEAAWLRSLFDSASGSRTAPRSGREPRASSGAGAGAPWPAKVRYGIAGPLMGGGGGERFALDVIRYVGDRHHYVGAAYQKLVENCETLDADYAAFGPIAYGDQAIRDLARRVDVLLAWGVAWLDRLLPTPRPCRLVCDNQGSGKWARKTFDTCGYVDAIVACSRVAANNMPRALANRAEVIWNTFSPERVRPEGWDLRKDWGVPAGRLVIGQAARLAKEKHPEAIVYAASSLERRSPGRFAYVVIGEGHEEARVRALAERLGVGANIIWAGYEKRMGDVYQALDWLLIGSHEEGGPIVALEAWAAGVPVISTPVGMVLEFPELVRMIPLGAGGGPIAAAIEADLADPERTRARINSARGLAWSEFSPQAFGERWARHFDRYVAEVPSAAEPLHDRIEPLNETAGLTNSSAVRPDPCVLAAFNRAHASAFRRRFLASLRWSGNREMVHALGYGLGAIEEAKFAAGERFKLDSLSDNRVSPAIRRLLDFRDILRSLPAEAPVAYWDAGDVVFQTELSELWTLVAANPGRLLVVAEPFTHPRNTAVRNWTRTIRDPIMRDRVFGLLTRGTYLNSGFAAASAGTMAEYLAEAADLRSSKMLAGSADWGDQTALNLWCRLNPERCLEVSEAWNYCLYGRDTAQYVIAQGGRVVSRRSDGEIRVVHGNGGTIIYLDLAGPALALRRGPAPSVGSAYERRSPSPF